jgi:two-component system LytT family sensor kinase
MKRIIEVFAHAFLWTTGFVLIVIGANTLGVFHKSDGSILVPVAIGTLINILIFYSVSEYFIPKFSIHRKTTKIIFQIALLLVISTSIESLIDYFFFSAKFSTAEEPFGSQLITNTVFNLIFLSIALAYGFIKSWIKNERLKQKLREEKLSAELDFLKGQINPHFLFNVLNTAYSSSVSHGDEVTSGIIEKLSGLLRHMLYESNSDFVDMDKEIEYIQNFISLQQLRLSNELAVKIDFNINGDFAKVMIAPLILVPFIENAFKHGIKLTEQCHIQISLTHRDNQLIFKVQNSNFPGIEKKSNQHSGIGLENVKRRLELLYPSRHLLTITNDKDLFSIDLQIQLKK